jgi:hypothetical protein
VTIAISGPASFQERAGSAGVVAVSSPAPPPPKGGRTPAPGPRDRQTTDSASKAVTAPPRLLLEYGELSRRFFSIKMHSGSALSGSQRISADMTISVLTFVEMIMTQNTIIDILPHCPIAST